MKALLTASVLFGSGLLASIIFFISNRGTLFYTILALIVSLIGMAVAMFHTARQIIRQRGRASLADAALALQLAVAAIAVVMWQGQIYLDVAFRRDLARREAVVRQINDPRLAAKPSLSQSEAVFIEAAPGGYDVMFEISSSLRSYEGFLYVAGASGPPRCLIGGLLTKSRQMDGRWYWVECLVD